jgi:hypothetical protein
VINELIRTINGYLFKRAPNTNKYLFMPSLLSAPQYPRHGGSKLTPSTTLRYISGRQFAVLEIAIDRFQWLSQVVPWRNVWKVF